MARTKRSLLVVALLSLAIVVSCKKKAPPPGSPCSQEGEATCVDATSRVVCKSGKNVLEKCVTCEQTKSRGIGTTSESSFFAGCVAGGIGPEGAACDGESWDCDGKMLVTCAAGKYHRIPCGGPHGCTHGLSGVNCDSTTAAPGDACRGETAACAGDKRGMLHCHDGVFVLDKSCHGPTGCVVEPEKSSDGKYTLHCDSTVASVGDPCIDGGSCSSDKLSIVKCDKGKYVPYKRCRGTVAECRLVGDTFECAESGVGEVGDACDGGGACSSDGKALLECKDGALAVRSRCRTCKVTGERVNCKF